MEMFTASPERLIIGATLGFAVLLFLIIKAKIQPFIAIMSSALIIGLVVGMPFGMIRIPWLRESGQHYRQ